MSFQEFRLVRSGRHHAGFARAIFTCTTRSFSQLVHLYKKNDLRPRLHQFGTYAKCAFSSIEGALLWKGGLFEASANDAAKPHKLRNPVG